MSDEGCQEFRPGAITVRTDLMLRMQGYRNLDRVRPIFKKTAGEMAHVFARTVDAVVRYRQLPSECRDGVLTLEGGTVFRCDAFAKYHAASEQAVVFVLTLGKGLDEVGIDLGERQLFLEQMFLATAGWLGVEAVNGRFATHVKEQVIDQGYRLTRRMAPGYSFKENGRDCSWRLEDQRPLFALFGDTELPVSLLESCVMLPRMSRSGLYGVTPVLSPS
jgi:hypothetical protein